MESLSPELASRLEALGLCRSDDIRRCRSLVRRLSYDLPAFDSVWLDALVQTRRLTPFQSRVIADGVAEELVAGPYLILNRQLGDNRLTTFVARHRESKEYALLTLIGSSADQRPQMFERLRESLERLHRITHPHLNTPRSVHLDRERLIVVSDRVTGPTLGELIVRRGRFPLPVVGEIARQLVATLAHLERHGALHGDLRLRNIRLESSGHVVLLHPELMTAVSPVVTIHSDVPPDCYDGVAPELIGTHQQRSTVSDLYGLGCLLWELIAGRPPFTTGDPLAKLAAHQSRTVADVREWNPDTPAPLAALLARLTSRDPNDRPQSFQDVEQALGRPSTSGRRILKRFARAFQSAAPRSQSAPAGNRPLPRQLATAAVLLLMLLAGSLSHRGARTELLRIVGVPFESFRTAHQTVDGSSDPLTTQKSATQDNPTGQSLNPGTSGRLKPLPTPDGQGLIQLDGAGSYRASSLSTVGPLTLKGPADGIALIEVDNAPWTIAGTTIVLENIQIESRTSPGRMQEAGTQEPLIDVTANDFGLSNCSLSHTSSENPLVRWTLLSPQSPTAGRLGLRNTILHGGSAAFEANHPRSIHIQNSLCVRTGSLLRLRSFDPLREIPITLRQVTLRESAIVSLEPLDTNAPARLRVSAERCVFQPALHGGLLDLRLKAGTRWSPRMVSGITITGMESLLQTAAPLVVETDELRNSERRDGVDLNIEGLQFAELDFRGSATRDATASALIETSSLPSAQWVGIDATAFPKFPPELVPNPTPPTTPLPAVRTAEHGSGSPFGRR